MRLATGQQVRIPFETVVPWETPITSVYGQHLHGMTMGVRTEVSVARAIDKGDLDPLSVTPLPIQERILDAFARLGFRFKAADLEYGRLGGVAQTLPFYQEIEYFSAPQYAQTVREVELTFVADPQTLTVVLEFDKRGGLFTAGHDAYGRYRIPHTDANSQDWAPVVDGWVREAMERRQSFFGHGGQGRNKSGHGGYGHHGSGFGGVAGGVVGGLAAGFLAGEVMGEMFGED
jgi:sporulation-control protein